MSFEGFLRDYLKALAVKNYAQGTLNWRRSYLKRLFARLDRQGTREPKNVTTEQIERYLLYLKEEYRTAKGKPLTDSSYQAHLQVITDFFRWLEETGQILISPVVRPSRPKKAKPVKLPVVLTEEEAVRILESCSTNTPAGLRDRAVLELLYSTGIRRSELLNLDREDFFADRQELLIRQGKGKKDRLVPVGEYAVCFIQGYLKLVRPWLVNSPEEKALFLSMNGTRLAPQTLKLIVAKAVRKSGVTKRVTPHTFRHSIATHLLRNKADIRHIQALLGHDSLLSTEIYTHLTAEDLKQAFEKAHPRAKR